MLPVISTGSSLVIIWHIIFRNESMWLELFFFSLRPLLALVPLRLGVTDAKSRTRCVVGCGAVFVSLLLQQGRPLAAKLGCKPYSLVPSNGCQVLNQLIIFIYFFFFVDQCLLPWKIQANTREELEVM